MSKGKQKLSRRKMLKRLAAVASIGPLFRISRLVAGTGEPNKNSYPSDLKITDMRGCTIASNYDYPIIRIDTNQGVYGLGEVFCTKMISQALLLKPYIVGKNPLQIENVLAPLREFTSQDLSGGYSAIDIALHDIAGKVYNVPAWRLLGNKLQEKLIVYCDTTGHPDPKVYGERMKKRMDQGFRFFKMDLYTKLVADKKGALDNRGVATKKGLEYLCAIIEGVRNSIGNLPLAADHFGRLTVDDAIRYGKAFEPYHLAWAEDFLSPDNWKGYVKVTNATTTPTLVGEHTFGLQEGFMNLIKHNAVDLIHPDVTRCGGLLEGKRIADFAAIHGIPTVLHMANSPVGQVASAHLGATLTKFICVEYHAVDIPWWDDLVTGVSKPIIDRGYQMVPDAPGLGIELNEEVVREHLQTIDYAVPGGYFEPTPMYDKPLLGGHPKGPYLHYNAEGKLVNDLDSHGKIKKPKKTKE